MRVVRFIIGLSILLTTVSMNGFSQCKFQNKDQVHRVSFHDDGSVFYGKATNAEDQSNFRCSFLTLNNLARAAELINNNKPFDCLYSLLVRVDERADEFRRSLEKWDGSVVVHLNQSDEASTYDLLLE